MLLECRQLTRDPRPNSTVDGAILLNPNETPRFIGGCSQLFVDWRCQGLPFDSLVFNNTDAILMMPGSALVRTAQHDTQRNCVIERYYVYLNQEQTYQLIKTRTRYNAHVETAVNLLGISYLRGLVAMSQVTDPLLKLFFDIGRVRLNESTIYDLAIELFRHTMFTEPRFASNSVVHDAKTLMTKLIGLDYTYGADMDAWYTGYMAEFEKLPCVIKTKQSDGVSISHGGEMSLSPRSVHFTLEASLLNTTPCRPLMSMATQTYTFFNHQLFAEVVQEIELCPLTDFSIQGVLRPNEVMAVKPFSIKFMYNRYSLFDGSGHFLESTPIPNFLDRVISVWLTRRGGESVVLDENLYVSITRTYDDEILIAFATQSGSYSEAYYYDLVSMAVNSFSACDASEFEVASDRSAWL